MKFMYKKKEYFSIRYLIKSINRILIITSIIVNCYPNYYYHHYAANIYKNNVALGKRYEFAFLTVSKSGILNTSRLDAARDLGCKVT